LKTTPTTPSLCRPRESRRRLRPDSSGFDTLDKIAAAARSPIIVVTGNPHPALVPEALKRRAYEVLRKSELDGRSLMRSVCLASLQNA
jgi:DNA-binding NarL/FixJ family response regulator